MSVPAGWMNVDQPLMANQDLKDFNVILNRADCGGANLP
jgi:hypothetical protein